MDPTYKNRLCPKASKMVPHYQKNSPATPQHSQRGQQTWINPLLKIVPNNRYYCGRSDFFWSEHCVSPTPSRRTLFIHNFTTLFLYVGVLVCYLLVHPQSFCAIAAK